MIMNRNKLTPLQEAKKVVESVAEAKNAFLGNLSHEVRTPLNGIIAAAQLLANSGPSLTIEQVTLQPSVTTEAQVIEFLPYLTGCYSTRESL